MPIASIKVSGMVSGVSNVSNFTRETLINAARAIKSEMLARQKSAYQLGGHEAHRGMQWKALSPATVAIKAKMGVPFPAAPLVRTGAMSQKQLVDVEVGVMPNGSVRYEVWARNNAPYAGYHQSGFSKVVFGRHTTGFVSWRHPVEFSHDDLEWIESMLRNYMGDDGSENKVKRSTLATKAARFSRGAVNLGRQGWFGLNTIFGRFARR